MAMMLLCSVFDTKVGAFSAPFQVSTKAEAVRSFMDACEDSKLPFAKHPGDYRLFYVGDFDNNSGVLTRKQPEPLIGADEVVPRARERRAVGGEELAEELAQDLKAEVDRRLPSSLGLDGSGY